MVETDPAGVEKIYNNLPYDAKAKLALPMAGFYAKHHTPGKELFVARQLFDDSNLLKMFSRNEDNAFPEAAEWVSSGDNVEANRLLADMLYSMAEKYKQYGLNGMALIMVRNYISNQQKNKGPHQKQIIDYYKKVGDKINKL